MLRYATLCYAGAHALKLFPAVGDAAATLKALMAVLPAGTRVVAVGGVSSLAMMRPFWAAGAAGFGLGSALFKPGMPTAEVASHSIA